MEFLYYSYCRKSTGWEFFVPARTLIDVKLLTAIWAHICTQRFDELRDRIIILLIFFSADNV